MICAYGDDIHDCVVMIYQACGLDKQRRNFLLKVPSLLEQGTGIEPASEAWEAPIIADILTLHIGYIVA